MPKELQTWEFGEAIINFANILVLKTYEVNFCVCYNYTHMLSECYQINFLCFL